jgi:hypothetical protein
MRYGWTWSSVWGSRGKNSLGWVPIGLDKVQDALAACWTVLAAIGAVLRGQKVEEGLLDGLGGVKSGGWDSGMAGGDGCCLDALDDAGSG